MRRPRGEQGLAGAFKGRSDCGAQALSLRTLLAALVVAASPFISAAGADDSQPSHAEPGMSPEAQVVPHDSSVFGSDPSYEDKPYDPDAQWKIYGDKKAVTTQRPLLELGRELYQYGPFQPGLNLLGEKNKLFPHFMAFGDWRTAVAYNDNGQKEQGIVATRLNLDLDLKLTATERVHAFIRPVDKNGQFTSYVFSGDDSGDDDLILDANLEALFFEGDLNPILSGISDKDMRFDLPFAGGLMPLLFQNGVWVEDAFTGFAFTIPARNSPMLDISNMDITFFAGFDRVTTGALPGNDNDANVFGVTAFIEANRGYWELGYGYTSDESDIGGLSYHNLTAAFTKRYANLLSNTVRVIANVGQNPNAGRRQTADGWLLLVENSLITSKPSTFIPYMNFFAGFDRPQSLARDAGAGGVLKNTGILFETDGLTGFPKMDDTANNTYGAAFGINYLFDLDQQIVLEAAVLEVMGDDADRVAAGSQYGIGARWQKPINNAMILRADIMRAWREDDEDLFGVRFEFRWKF